jgi:hypothetical protein
MTKHVCVLNWGTPFTFVTLTRGIFYHTDVSTLPLFPSPQTLAALSHKDIFKQIQRVSPWLFNIFRSIEAITVPSRLRFHSSTRNNVSKLHA